MQRNRLRWVENRIELDGDIVATFDEPSDPEDRPEALRLWARRSRSWRDITNGFELADDQAKALYKEAEQAEAEYKKVFRDMPVSEEELRARRERKKRIREET